MLNPLCYVAERKVIMQTLEKIGDTILYDDFRGSFLLDGLAHPSSGVFGSVSGYFGRRTLGVRK